MSVDVPQKSPTVVFKSMDEGGVLFCSRTEIYFGLNEVGVAIWGLLPEPEGAETMGLGGLLDSLQERYPEVERAALATDVQEFIEALHEGELVAYDRSERG